jgi:hypothetical protein
MIGTASNKQFFYSEDAVEIKSNVWMEWNYNSIIQPFVTTTSYAKPTYLGPTTWSVVGNSTIAWTSSAKSSMNQARAIPANHYNWNASATGANFIADFQVSTASYSDTASYSYTFASNQSGYFKIVFYAKANFPIYQGTLSPVVSTSATYGGGAGSIPAVYAVQSVGKYGHLSRLLDASQFTLNRTSNVSESASSKITWTSRKDDGAIAYNVYRLVPNTSGVYSSFAYLGTVQKQKAFSSSDYTASYKDIITTPSFYSYSPYIEQNNISLLPTMYLTDASGNLIDFNYKLKTTDPTGGNEFDNAKSVQLDGMDWQKIEVYFTSNNNFTFKTISLQLNVNSFFLAPNIQVGPAWLYEISESDYINSKYFPLDSVFSGKRPGEALLNPFIDTYENSASFNYYREMSINDLLNGQYSSMRKNTYSYMNVSNVYEKTTDGLGYFQMIPASSDKYKYYISDISSADKGISAYYDQYISINKVYLKINDVFSYPSTTANSSSFVIYYNVQSGTASGTASAVVLPGPFSFDSNGISVFYYKDGNWLNSSGSAFSSSIKYAASANSTVAGGWLPPTINNNGQISTSQIFTQVTGLAFKSAIVPTNAFPDNAIFGAGLPSDPEDTRLHIQEISPRLEIDITDFVQNYNISKELSNEDSGNNFPLGFITSNSGNLSINNFPVYYNNQPFSIFENKNSQSFLYDLLTQGVKFTGYFRSTVQRSDFTNIIPSFVMYSEDFTIQDLNSVDVTMFDLMKTSVMSSESPHYLAAGETIYDVVNNLFALSGFSDYSKSELKTVCKNKNQFSYFWTEESKTIAQCIQEIFISNQIGCFLDETGFMRFIDIDSIISNKLNDNLVTNFDISDVTSSSFNYLPNMVMDSYSESLGTTIGKILVNYILPNSFVSPVSKVDDNISEQKENISTVFSESSKYALAHSFLTESCFIDDDKFRITSSFIDNPKNNPGINAGTFFIGCEAVRTEGLKYAFVVSGSPGYTFEKTIRYDSDINDAIQNSISQLGKLSSNIKYSPTGYFVGVSRGCYGTKPKDHPVLDLTNANSYFNYKKYANPFTSFTTLSFTTEVNNNSSLSIPVSNGETKIIYPKSLPDTKYNHFSFSFVAADNAVVTTKKKGLKNCGVGVFYGFDGTTQGSGGPNDPFMIFIEKDPNGNQSRMYFKTMKNTKIVLRDSQPINAKQNYVDTSNLALGKNLFDGEEHRISIWINDSGITVRIDDSSAYIKAKGQLVSSIANNSVAFSQDEFSQNYFGFFVTATNFNGNAEKNPQVVTFKEFYACDYPTNYENNFDLENNPKYHIQTKTFLSNMLSYLNEPSYYLWQSKPKLIGFKHYSNEKYQAAPVMIDKLSSVFEGYNPSWKASSILKSPALKVGKNDLSVSKIDSTPFMFSQIVVNNTSSMEKFRTILFLKTENDSIKGENNNDITISPYQIQGQKLFFTDERKYEKIIDPNHITNSIELATKWIQSENDAKNIIKKISAVLPQFNSTLEVDIFGNPLVQVGDIAGLWFYQKNIGFDSSGTPINSLKYLTTKVSQNWDGGLQTSLSLKPIK